MLVLFIYSIITDINKCYLNVYQELYLDYEDIRATIKKYILNKSKGSSRSNLHFVVENTIHIRFLACGHDGGFILLQIQIKYYLINHAGSAPKQISPSVPTF